MDRSLDQVTNMDSFTKHFHRLNRVLRVDQVLIKVSPTETVAEAFKLMRKGRFSQLPVVEGNAVLGLFSYRSFSERLVRLKKIRNDVGNMPVEEFLEKVEYARVTDEFSSVHAALDRDDAVLMGEQDRLRGIVTAIDVLRYLYGVANPFLLVAEIELTVRALITEAVDPTMLAHCAEIALMNLYGEGKVPKTLKEMTFNDYVLIVGFGDNWKYFEPIFGGMRENVRVKLEEIRDLRNDVFHFKKDLSVEEHEHLADHREWILSKARKIEARQGKDKA